MAEENILQDGLEEILARYVTARTSEPFGKSHDLWSVFQSIERALEETEPVKKHPTLEVTWSTGQGNWARIPWISLLDQRETTTTQEGVYCVFLFRQDMSGVYLTYNQGVTALNKKHGRTEARRILQSHAQKLRERCGRLLEYGFSLDNDIDLRTDATLGRDYEHSTIAYKLYERGNIPSDDEILKDVAAVIGAYEDYLTMSYDQDTSDGPKVSDGEPPKQPELRGDLERVRGYVAKRGFVFEPWQIAAYVTALRTKPFVILAGVSGTGKSKLPRLVAEATGARCELVPVRPNWTDSSDVLGYQDLRGEFRPGPLLRLARTAEETPETHHVCIIDEMNLARVEYYFAEVLSRMEDRRMGEGGGCQSRPLLSIDLKEEDSAWADQGLPPNLAIVGTVNMDETTHSFSRKVLDRAFTLEFSDIDLTVWSSADSQESVEPVSWAADRWFPRAVQIADFNGLSGDERDAVDEVVNVLNDLNKFLVQAQLQVGYRTRDEAALFVLHAREFSSSFITTDGDAVDPLDLVLHMKVLPRIVGGSNAVRRLLLDLLGWAERGIPLQTEQEANAVLDRWAEQDRGSMLSGANYPQTAARLCLMWDRLHSEGFTSFWL